jgi:putative ABC transport system permease protein
MTLKDIAFGNLRRRKAKAAFVLAGLVIGVSTAVALLSLSTAMRNDIGHKLEMYGANILIVPKTESLSLSYGGLSLGGVSFDMKEIREEDLEKIWDIKNHNNIAALGPIVLGPVTISGSHALLAGVNFEAFNTLRPWWKIKGKTPKEKEAIAGSDAARVLGLSEGSRVSVQGQPLTISGVLETTGSQDDGLIFTPLATAQTLLGKKGRISMVEVAALCSGCPIPEMVKQISAALPGANVMGIQQVVKGRMETISQFERFSFGVSVLVLLVGGLMVLITMMGSIRERTVEIGIFRAMGFRRSHIMRVILLEAAAVSAVAGILGWAVGLAGTRALVPFFTESDHVMLPFDPYVGIGALGLAVVLGLLSSVYPALVAARLDPNEALRAL